MRSALTVLAGVFGATLAFAQDPPPAGTATGRATTTTTTTTQFHRVSTIVGTTVTLEKETLGKVTEVVINDQGCIEYVIVSYREAFIAVPWRAATVNYEQRTVVLRNTQVTVDRLRDLTFTEDRWPNFTDRQWTERMRTVWGAEAFRTGTTGRQDPPATDRRDRPNTDPANRRERPNTDPANRPERRDPPPPAGREERPTTPGERPKADPPANPPPRKDPPADPANPGQRKTDPPRKDPPANPDRPKSDPPRNPDKPNPDKPNPDKP